MCEVITLCDLLLNYKSVWPFCGVDKHKYASMYLIDVEWCVCLCGGAACLLCVMMMMNDICSSL